MIWNDTLRREIPVEWDSKSISELVSGNTRGINPIYNEKKVIPVINQKWIRNSNIIFDEAYWNGSKGDYNENYNLWMIQ